MTKLSNDYDDDLIKEYQDKGFSMIWTMKDGTEILLKNMEDSHINNCIKMLRRNSLTETRRSWIDIFIDVQLKRRKLKIDKIKSKLNSE